MTPDTWAENFESFERINSIRETIGNFDSCNSCKGWEPCRLHELHESKFTSHLHELHESKFPFVSPYRLYPFCSVRNFRIFLLMYLGRMSRRLWAVPRFPLRRWCGDHRTSIGAWPGATDPQTFIHAVWMKLSESPPAPTRPGSDPYPSRPSSAGSGRSPPVPPEMPRKLRGLGVEWRIRVDQRRKKSPHLSQPRAHTVGLWRYGSGLMMSWKLADHICRLTRLRCGAEE